MKNRIGLNFDDEVDYSLLTYTAEQIDGFEKTAHRLGDFFSLPVNEENFNNAITTWLDLVSALPLPVLYTESNFIIRSRPSKEYQIFQDEADISYNTKCPEKISLGRFNRPAEAVFYGTLPSDDQAKFVSAVSIESFKELISDKNTADVLYYHFCKFNVKEQFPIFNLCFEPRVLSLHPGLNRGVTGHLLNLNHHVPKASYEAIVKFWCIVSSIHTCLQEYTISGVDCFSREAQLSCKPVHH